MDHPFIIKTYFCKEAFDSVLGHIYLLWSNAVTITAALSSVVCYRNFLPSLEDFFEDAIEQLDPENQVDEEFWLVHVYCLHHLYSDKILYLEDYHQK